MKHFFTTLLFIAFSSLSAFSQLIGTVNSNGNQLAQILAGNGVTVSNVQLNCPLGAAGTFNCQNCNLGMNNGVVLTSGSVDSISGPNNNSGINFQSAALGDQDLDNLVWPDVTYDACVLEFDIRTLSDSVEFNYIFGSEEYLEFVFAGFNDVFAFFISGPGIAGQENIALIPGTTIPVSIDNVNTSNYPQYYIDNGDGYTPPQNTSPYYIQYDGFTTLLTAKKKGLQPCQTYHLKLAIADVGDDALDSGVFLEANSLSTNYVSMDRSPINAVEGCMNGLIRVYLQYPVSSPTVVHYQITGSATNGIDYNQITDSVIIPAGDTVSAINIIPVNDGITEGQERVVISLYNQCSNFPYDSAVIFIYDSVGVHVGPDTAICRGDNVQLSATATSGYLWSPATGLSATNISNPFASPTVTTSYRCSTSIGSCTAIDSVTVTVITPPFTVNAGNDTSSCSGTNVQLNAVVTGSMVNGNPFVYLWSPSVGLSSVSIANPVATPSSPTSYVIQVSSGYCQVSDTINVALGSMQITTSSTNETCSGSGNGTATANPNGQPPYQYYWNTTATTQTISGLTAGTYYVTVNDNGGCSGTASVLVGTASQIIVTPSIIHVLCFGGNNGAISLSINGGTTPYTFNWGGGITSQNRNSLAAGTYSVTVTDANSCNISTTINVNQPATPLAATSTVTDATCFGSDGAITLSASGGTSPYGFNWGGGISSQNRTGLNPGSYTVTVTDANLCTFSLTSVVSQTGTVLQLSPAITDATCNGKNDGAINLNISGGVTPYSYNWGGGITTQNRTLLTAGVYTVTVNDAGGCSASASYTVAEPTVITFGTQNISGVTCFGYSDGSALISPTGGTGNFTYTWNGTTGNNPNNNLSAGTYNVIVTDGNGCTVATTVVVTEPLQLNVSLTPHDATCYDASNGTIDASPSGGTLPYGYSWSNGSSNPNAAGLQAGIYSMTITDNNNCTATATTIVNQPYPLDFTPEATPVKCIGDKNGTIRISPTGGTAPYSFSATQDWSNFFYPTGPEIINLASGTYNVVLNDSNGCTQVKTVFVPEPLPDSFVHTEDSTSCYGAEYSDGSVHIEALTIQNSPFRFGIDGGELSYSEYIYNLSAGSHVVTAENVRGCITTFNIVIPEPQDGIAAILPSDTTLQLGDVIQMYTSFSPYSPSTVASYTWQPAAGLSCSDCPNPQLLTYARQTEYRLTIVYNEHCVAKAKMKVMVESNPEVFVPNSFSPNGDGNNDVWLIYGEKIKTIDLKIFNRWGEKVFESNNQSNGWDGTYKGQLQNPAVFTFTAKVTFLDNKTTDRIGSIMLLR